VHANEVNAVTLLCTKHHPNIVEVVDHGQLNVDYYYIDMELCGLTLADLLKEQDKGEGLRQWFLQWPIADLDQRNFFILALMQELANGLYFIHKHDQVHRDIKPENSETPDQRLSDLLL
jgi:serine/threonine protein kinase